MRQAAALTLGIWYACVLSLSLGSSIKQLSANPNSGHYVLLGLAWFSGIAIASGLAACASKSHPALIATLTAAIISACLIGASYAAVSFWGADSMLPPLLFGWRPAALMWGPAVGLIVIPVSAAVGLEVGKSDEALFPGIFGIRGLHWLWLWIPMSSWAAQVPDCLYLIWLDFALGWHWLFHPSLWFDWRYLLFCMFGVGLTVLPLNFLTVGMSKALECLIDEDEPRRALTFAKYGIGMGIILPVILIFCAYWILWHLPIVSGAAGPWWVIH